MKVARAVLVPVTVALLVSHADGQAPQPREALDGVDPVVLLQTGQERFGQSALSSTYGSLTYLFSSEATKAEFEASPQKYAVQMHGLCARMGGAVSGNPANYAVVHGRIYIFGSDDCRTRFIAAPDRFIPPSRPPLPADPDAERRGKEVLDRAAAAHGGRALDTMQTYAERYRTGLAAPAPSGAALTTLSWRFPDAVRSERTFANRNGQLMTVATVIAGRTGWSGLTSPELTVAPMNPAGVPEMKAGFERQLVPLLRTRAADGTAVVYLGAGRVENADVDRVRLRRGGLDVVLNIQDGGRVHSVSLAGRNAEGEFGEMTVLFGDYRLTDGVLVPFSEEVVHDGTPQPALSRILESADVNPPLDPALLDFPARTGR